MKQVIAIALMVIAGQAHAWGDREQGILAGVFGTILLQKIAQQNQQPVLGQPPVSVGEAPVYSQPQIIVQQQPRVIVVPQQPRMYIPAPRNRCEVVPMYDHWGRYVAEQTVCNW